MRMWWTMSLPGPLSSNGINITRKSAGGPVIVADVEAVPRVHAHTREHIEHDSP